MSSRSKLLVVELCTCHFYFPPLSNKTITCRAAINYMQEVLSEYVNQSFLMFLLF